MAGKWTAKKQELGFWPALAGSVVLMYGWTRLSEIEGPVTFYVPPQNINEAARTSRERHQGGFGSSFSATAFLWVASSIQVSGYFWPFLSTRFL